MWKESGCVGADRQSLGSIPAACPELGVSQCLPVLQCLPTPCESQHFLTGLHILPFRDCPMCPGLAGHQEGHLCRDDSVATPHG